MNGREGLVDPIGWADSARIAAKEAMIAGVTTASAPPARATSTRPYRMRSMACPTASVPEAHALVTVRASPVMRRASDTCDAACEGTVIGVVSGETARGPRSRSLRSPPTRTEASPRMEPTETPTRSGASPLSPVPHGVESGVLPGLAGGEHRELGGPVHPPRLRPGQQSDGVHGHGPRDPHRQSGELLALQLTYAAAAFEQPLPQFPDSDTEGRHGAEPGDDDPARRTGPGGPARTRVMAYDVSLPDGSRGPLPHLRVRDRFLGPAVQIRVPLAPPTGVRLLDGPGVNDAQRTDAVSVPEFHRIEIGGDGLGNCRHVQPTAGDGHLTTSLEYRVVILPAERRPQCQSNGVRSLGRGVHHRVPGALRHVLIREGEEITGNHFGDGDGVGLYGNVGGIAHVSDCFLRGLPSSTVGEERRIA